MAQAVEGGGAEHAVGREGVAPFGKVQVAGQHRRCPLIALGDEIVEHFILGRTQGFQPEVVDDQQIHPRQRLQAPLVAADRQGVLQARQQLSLGHEQHVIALTRRGVAQRLSQVALAGAAGAGDQDRHLLLDETAGGQVCDLRPVEIGQTVEIEALQRLVAAEIGPPQTKRKLLLLAPGHLVLDQERQEIGKAELAVDRFAVPRFQGIENAGQAQLLEGGGEFWNGIHGVPFLMDEQGLRIAAEAAAFGISGSQRVESRHQRLLVQPLLEDDLHRPVGRRAEMVGPPAGGLQSGIAKGLGQAQHALHRPQPDQHRIGEQRLHQGMAGRPDALRLLEAPLGVLEIPEGRLRRQMVRHRGTRARPGLPHVGGDQLVRLVEAHHRVGRLQPQALAGQPERHRVVAALELDMGIAVDLDLGPHGQLRRHVRQRREHGLLALGEARQRLLPRRAVNAVAGLGRDPVLHLAVGVSKIAEFPQGQEAGLHVLYTGLDDALLLRVARRAGVDPEAVAFRAFGVGALDVGLIQAGAGDGALGVVDDEPAGHPAEPLERMAVAGEPGGDGLVANHLDVLVAGETQGHDEEPGLEHFAGGDIGDGGAGPEIHLGGFPRLEVEAHGHLWRLLRLDLAQDAVDRGIAAGIAMPLDQHPMDAGAGDAGGVPLNDLFPPGFQGGDATGGQPRLVAEDRGKQLVVGQGNVRGQPAAIGGGLADMGQLLAAHQARPGNIPVGIALAHAHQGLSVVVHLEPPFAHGFSWQKSREDSRSMKVRDPKSGSGWLLYAGNTLAPLRRKQNGSIAAENDMNLNFDGNMDPEGTEQDAITSGDYLVDLPFRKYARVWLKQDYLEAIRQPKPKKTPLDPSSLDEKIESTYTTSVARPDVESTDDHSAETQLPRSGMQIHLEYTVYGHFFFLRALFKNIGKVRFYLDQDSAIRAACLSAFWDRVKNRTVDAYYVQINKELTNEQKLRRQGRIKKALRRAMGAYPNLTEDEVKLLFVKTRMAKMKPIGKLEDMWLRHPFPRMDEPKKAVCHLTNFGDYTADQAAKLYHRATLAGIDRFFMQVRRRISMLERPFKSPARAGRTYFAYNAYNPEMIVKLLGIFRVYYNYVAVGEDEQTPAMRLGLAKGPIRPEDIIYFTPRG